jgi:hypothetical protein
VTYAPADLLAVRQFLLTSTGLSGDAVGIVGDPDHASTGGYHEGNDDLARVGRLNTDYSKRESARDRPGTNAASAIDYGTFRKNVNGVWVSDRTVTAGLVLACQRGDPRTRDVREVIYTPDGSTVRRFDRLGIRSTGDSSHLYHTHISFFRDSEGRRARPDNILGLLTELMGAATVDFAPADTNAWIQARRTEALVDDLPTVLDLGHPNKLRARLVGLEGKVDQLIVAAAADAARDAAAKVAIDALATALAAGGGSVDSAAVIARINEVADAESTTVTALRAEVASLRADLAEAAQAAADAFDA